MLLSVLLRSIVDVCELWYKARLISRLELIGE
jgi:hypothetical protein